LGNYPERHSNLEYRNSRTQKGLRSSLFSVIKVEISLNNKFDISDLSPTPLKPHVVGAFFVPIEIKAHLTFDSSSS
jgi:hypothetical protein